MKPKQKPQPDEFWKIAELRKLMNLCDNEMETSTMPLKLRYEGEIKLMQQAEAFGRADERAKTQLEDKKEFLRILHMLDNDELELPEAILGIEVELKKADEHVRK